MDVVDLNLQVSLVVLDASDFILDALSVNVELVDVSADDNGIALKLGQASLESALLALMIAVGCVESVDLSLDVVDLGVEVVVVIHESGHVDLDVISAHEQLIDVSLQLRDVGLA